MQRNWKRKVRESEENWKRKVDKEEEKGRE